MIENCDSLVAVATSDRRARPPGRTNSYPAGMSSPAVRQCQVFRGIQSQGRYQNCTASWDQRRSRPVCPGRAAILPVPVRRCSCCPMPWLAGEGGTRGVSARGRPRVRRPAQVSRCIADQTMATWYAEIDAFLSARGLSWEEAKLVYAGS